MKNILKKTFRIVAIAMVVLIALILIFFVALRINSTGRMSPILDQDGSLVEKGISEILEMELGGETQTILIRGMDSTRPVLLYLHGGPGGISLSLRSANPDLEKYFVVAYWEQLGCGKSYHPDIPASSMTFPAFVKYTSELGEYLKNRFRQDKIWILGESWGTQLGMFAVQQRPELYHGFIGVGNIAHTYRGEKISLEWLKMQAKERNDAVAMAVLDTLTFPDSLASGEELGKYFGIQRRYLHDYGGVNVIPKSGFDMFKTLFMAKEYTLREKLDLGTGINFTFTHLSPSVMQANMFRSIDSLKVPAYFIQGKSDFASPTSIAREFYGHVRAPHKEFHVFENSAHSPHMEEPEKFNSLIRRIVFGE